MSPNNTQQEANENLVDTEADVDLPGALNTEAAKIPWQELQTFFARGQVIQIAPSLDLIDVAVQIAKDNKALIEPWMATGQIAKVSDEQAKLWIENDAVVWALVIKPWVLVQAHNI